MKRSCHLQLAHHYWQKFLSIGDIAIDATCGNGLDSIVLANCILQKNRGMLYLYDTQKQAIENTKSALQKKLLEEQLQRVTFFPKSHESFHDISVQPHLIVYNLGYLPGYDKSYTTQTESTLKSLQNAFAILADKGAISIMCYPGHEEGKKELFAVKEYLQTLDPFCWEICFHQWINRPKSPVLFWIMRSPLQ